MEWVYIIVIVVIILLIFYLFDVYTFNRSIDIYNKIDNDNDIETAHNYINTVSRRFGKRTPIENYRMGNLYDFMLRDDEKAHEYYLQAINQVIQEPTEDALFIQTRLRDRINIEDVFEIDDNKYNLFNLDELDNELQELELALARLYTTDFKEGLQEAKTLEERVQWKSDSQNVHDSNINNELRTGYEQIKIENSNNFIWEIQDIEDYVKYTYSKEADDSELHNITPALKMLEYIKLKGANNIMKLETSEREFMGHIFTKIYNEPDTKKRKNMLENLMLNLKESYGNGSPVCITGRVTRILTSFADMDDTNPTLGILKAKPVLRNEILMKAADIRNKIYEESPNEIKEKYDKSVEDQDTKDLENNIKQQIKSMIKKDYSRMERDDPKFIQGVIEEIEASI